MIPMKLRCECLIDPLGIDTVKPRLSWILQSEQRGQEQNAYQLIVADSEEELQQDRGNLWDSGEVGSKETIQVVYDGEPLESGMRCFWKVRVWGKDGEVSAWSEPASWEMALLNDHDWAGEWLNDGKSTPESDEELYEDDPAPLFRKEFSIPKEIRCARLYITGLGYYEAHINGQRVGDHVLDPGWTNYSKRVLYSTYDVTDHLQSGENCVGVMLGNGWYNPLPLRMWGNRNLRENLPTGRPRFIAQLNIDFADGSSQSISTDASWKVHDGPILRNNVYLGEVYDARKEIEGWDQPRLDDTAWRQAQVASEPVGQLQAQSQPPVKITATLKPVNITEPEPGTYIFDFGQNFAGWVRMKLTGTAGTKVKLRYGELLNVDGTLNVMTSVCGQIKREGVGGPGAPEIAYQSDTYIAKGVGEEVYAPRFAFHGFRYVEVTGYPGVPTLDSLKGLRLNSAVDEVGSFECSNDMLNQIQEMTRWTFLSNIFSVQSDCPHREKFGYGGDIAVTSDAFMLNFDMANFYARAVRDWHDAALPDGMLTDTAPFVGIQYCGVAWALAHPLLLYKLYQYYGNSRLLEEQYQTASRWLDLVASQNPDHIIQEGLSDHEGLEETPSPQMVTPLYYYSARLLSRLAGILGLEDDQERYDALAHEIKDAYIQNFLEPGTGKIDPGTQASQAFALYLGLVPSEEKQAAVDFLIDRITGEHKGHLSTGIFGTKFLLHVLSELGYTDIAYSIVGQRSFPGWGFMLENDATTLWEHWDFSDDTFSHNHPMFGSVSEWFYGWLAGIQPHPDAMGFDRIIIRPQVLDCLNRVKAHYNSIRGQIASEWRYENGKFTLDVTIPPNTSATVFIPAKEASNVTESGGPADSAEGVRFLAFDDGVASYEIGSGTYSFSHFTPPRGGRWDYKRANKLRELTKGKIYRDKVEPHWFADNSRFWYRNDLSDGHREFVIVDTETGSREPAFDHARLADALGRAIGKRVWSDRLPFDGIEFLPEDNIVKFQAEDSVWHCDLQTYLLNRVGEAEEKEEDKEEEDKEPEGEESPDGKWFAFFREHNLCVRNQETGEEFALSTDGNPENEYSGKIFWSPDSSKVVAIRTRQGDKHIVYLIESSPEDQLQPKLHSSDYLKPGDQIPLPKPQLFDVTGRKRIPVSDELFPNPWSIRQVHWTPDSNQFTFLYNQRGHQVLRVIAVNAETGNARTIIEEQSETFVDYSHKQFSHHIDETREIIWMSERDGWNHLYLYDSESGEVKNQITSGEWLVRGVDHVDEEKRQVWFRAGGIYPEQDPYYVHYCRINLDGTGLVILTEGDGTHSSEYSPDRRFLIDTWSRVDFPPVTELRSAEDGSLVRELERADWSELLNVGWKAPERFVAKGRDGQTDIYGLIYRPTSFDPDHKYPVIEQIYAGPHGSHVPKSFEAFRRPHETAELGFIVVQIDGMGTSDRSKKFHDVCWKNLGDSGFPDRILWIKAAAEKYPYMDISRVGIYGGSAGGQSSTRALLAHGDFYKVAVSDCGCHDNRMDKIWWNELWMGWPIGSHYDEQANATQAHRLQGKLMLVVGELDRNVDPASTMQVVNALIKADKDFDLLVVPGGGHGIAESQYGNRRRQDYFVRHLLGVEPRSQP